MTGYRYCSDFEYEFLGEPFAGRYDRNTEQYIRMVEAKCFDREQFRVLKKFRLFLFDFSIKK